MQELGEPAERPDVVKELAARYDNVAYYSAAFAPSRPDNLSVVAALHGLSTAGVNDCRVLEIGCAGGGNILPMAEQLPGSGFVGIDLSPKQIEAGQNLVRELRLTNIELRCQDVLDFTDDQPFDYVIAHGFYSWAPRAAQDALMRVCQKVLAPAGLAYMSYNALPGWHIKRASRDMMLFHAREARNGAQRVARGREMMAIAAANPPPEPTPYAAALKQLAASLPAYPDWFLEHDELGLVNYPVYFRDFVAHAQAHDLCYLGGAQPASDVFQQLPPELQERLRSFTNDPLLLEQYADHIWGTQYRDAVLCRKEAIRSSGQRPIAVTRMWIAAALEELPFAAGKQPRNEVRFVNGLQKREIISSDRRLIAVLRSLAAAWPRAVSFAELFKQSRAAAGQGSPLSEEFLSRQILGWYESSIAELWTRPTDFIVADSPLPCLTPLARAQAAAGAPVINRRHAECRFPDALMKQLIPLMDGTRDREALIADLSAILVKNGSVPAAQVGTAQLTAKISDFLDGVSRTLSRNSLLGAKPAQRV